jgi:hypothetical protein
MQPEFNSAAFIGLLALQKQFAAGGAKTIREP